MMDRPAFAPGSPSFVVAIVGAQVLTPIGAFTLPALLPGYIERWSLSKTEAGWLIGIFFAAYVPTVPVLLALTDRVPARRIYLIGTGLTALSHFGFAIFADGFWSGLLIASDIANVVALRLTRESAHVHVVDQTLAQWADRSGGTGVVHRLAEAETLRPPRAVLNRATPVGPLLVHQYPAPLPRSGFVLRPAPLFRLRAQLALR
jgi:MFS family permease